MDIPPLRWHDGKLTVFHQRQYIDSAQRFEGAFQLTPDHVAALDLSDVLANDPDLHIGCAFVRAICNSSIIMRNSMIGPGSRIGPSARNGGIFLRLWLSLPGDRELPESFRQRYGSIEVGNRGGIITAETQLHARAIACNARRGCAYLAHDAPHFL